MCNAVDDDVFPLISVKIVSVICILPWQPCRNTTEGKPVHPQVKEHGRVLSDTSNRTTHEQSQIKTREWSDKASGILCCFLHYKDSPPLLAPLSSLAGDSTRSEEDLWISNLGKVNWH